MIKGCDISNWQSVTPQGYAFYIIKATEGVGFTDKRMTTHAKNAQSYGKPIGFYHFARPDLGNTATAEADYFVSVVKNYPGAVLALDLECKNYQNYVTWAKQWLNRVYKKTGVRPLLYVPGYYAKNFATVVKECNAGVWAPSSQSYYTGMPIVMTQSVANNLDVDYFYGTIEQFKKYGAGSVAKKKTNSEIAKEVVAGKWGNGQERINRLTEAGYDYKAVQKIVNEHYGIK